MPAVPEWLDGAYQSPLVARIAEIRRGILHRAQAGKWIIDVAQLTDQAIIRRMVLKRSPPARKPRISNETASRHRSSFSGVRDGRDSW